MSKKPESCPHGSPKCAECVREEQDAALLAGGEPVEVTRIANTKAGDRLDIPDKPDIKPTRKP